MGEPDFTSRLQAMIAKEASAANGDYERFAVMIEAVARALGFTLALATRGNGAAIDAMMPGIEGYVHSEAVEKAKFARFISEARGQ